MVATATLELVMKLVGRSETTMMAVSGSEVPGGGLAPLQAWLGQELESRGIDAVIYTRYILSILQQDPAFVGDDLDLAADNHFFPPSSGKRDGGTRSSKPGAQRTPAGRKLSDKPRWPVDVADCEERKKSAAVECLLSVSEEDCGIESLVEELYLKLKEQQAHTTDAGSGGTSQSDTAGSSDSDSSESSADPAQRYYAAFPALTTECQPANTSTTTSTSLPQEGGLWAAKVTQGLARRDGLVEPARQATVTWRLTPSPHSDHVYSEEQDGNRVRGRLEGYKSEWQCRCKGKYGEKRQKPSRYCAGCDSGNNRSRYRDHTWEKKSERSARSYTKGTEKTDEEVRLSLSPQTKIPARSTKAWKDYEYMRPIFIVPKVHSPDLNSSRVRSVRTNQKTESVLDFFFKSRVALASPLLDQMCYCGAESIWGCTAGCLNWPEMLGLGADSEDQSWYTEPLDMMVKPSPIPSRRLYNRRSVFGSLSNFAFFDNKLHVLEEALSDEDPQSLDSLGLSSLLSRTLEHCAFDAYLSDPEAFDTVSVSEPEVVDAEEEKVTKVVVEENIEENEIHLSEAVEGNDEIEFQPFEKCERSDDTEFNDQDSIKEEISFDLEEGIDDDEEVAYPSHIRPVILPSITEGKNLAEDGYFPEETTSPGESPDCQLQWDVSESMLEAFYSDSDTAPTPPAQVCGPEVLWDLPTAMANTHGESQLDGLGPHVGTIWGCGELSPPPTTDLLLVGMGTSSTWGFSSSSSNTNSKSASHASSQDNLYEGGGQVEYCILDDPCMACGQPATLSAGFGLGSGVWESTPLSPGSGKPGRMPTPSSTENQVLDDRPLFYLPLGDDEDFHKKHSLGGEAEADSPLPIPPLEFDFSDSEDDLIIHPAASDVHLHHSQSPTQTHSHLRPHSSSSPTSFAQAHHSHSCINNVHPHHHVDSWKDQNEATSSRAHLQEVNDTQRVVCAPKTGEHGGCGGIMASLTCDTLESSSSKSPRAALPHHDVLLTTSLPLFSDKSSIWSYCLENFLSPGSDHSLFVSPFSEDWPSSELFCTLPLSPKHEGSDLSHLWDINAVHRCHICEWASDKLAVGVETQNIRRYLMDVGFDPRSTHPDSTCTIIGEGLYESLLASGSWSVWGSATPTWSLWKDSPAKNKNSLRATPNTYNDTVSVVQSSSDQPNNNTEGAKLWKNFESRPHFFRQRSTSADHTEGVEQGFCGGHLSGSMSLLPSENSAFSDQIPPRVSLLPHVQSEPALDRQHPAHGRVYNHGRLVQVRSLYKSDTSILHQLGLASGHEDDPQAEVQVLPHTHFVPIASDTNIYTGSEAATTSTPKPAIKAEAKSSKMERIPTPLGPVPEVCPVLGRESSYQLYHHPEGDEEDEQCAVAFVPRFQVQKGTEKCCQTGDKGIVASGTPEGVAQRLAAELEAIAEIEAIIEAEAIVETEPEEAASQHPVENGSHQETLGMFLYDMQDVLELSVEDAERFMSNADTPPANLLPDDAANQEEVDYSSDYESMGAEQVSIEELGRAGIAELWEGDVVGGNEAGARQDLSADTPVLSPPMAILPAARAIASNSGSTSSAGGHYRSIWSWGAEPELPSLPNSFPSEHAMPHGHQLGVVKKLPKWSQGTDSVPLLGAEEEQTEEAAVQFAMDLDWPADSDDVFIDDPEVQMQLFGVDPNPEPDQVIFSRDLEQHWLNTHSSFTVQVPNPGHYKLSYHKKPCSFFLEGNCRRTDCKFAHDISNITCRFWEESTCFKGVTCPFLHGYPGESDGSESQRSSSERDFSLEQEEFPELGPQQAKETGGGKLSGSLGTRRRSGGSRKVEDRTRASFISEADRRRRSRQRVSAPSQGAKHASGKTSNNHPAKDQQEKIDDPAPGTDV